MHSRGSIGMIEYSIIVAAADNLAIGKENSMPWHVPEDLKLFKRRTIGNIIIMGRKTFDSIGRALPDRRTIVITSTPEKFNAVHSADNLLAVDSLAAALEVAAKTAGKQIYVAGGASIYAQAIEGASKLYLSRIPGDFEGDTYFPDFRDGSWNLESSEQHSGFILEVYLKKQ
ncbi:MAG TPA: hypothetical protein DCO79_12940 [Spirochaeta sp.]|nr:hypothetical protein [Spirochaeta sp.]